MASKSEGTGVTLGRSLGVSAKPAGTRSTSKTNRGIALIVEAPALGVGATARSASLRRVEEGNTGAP